MSNHEHIADIRLTSSCSTVYDPSDDSFALVDALAEAAASWQHNPPRLCVEVGCGSGYVIASVARLLRAAGAKPGAAAQCIATDINPDAVATTAATLAAHQVTGVDLACADMLQPLLGRLQGAVDLLVFNPPYVPTPDEELSRTGIAQAWAGGSRGRAVIDRFLPMVVGLLSPVGQLFMVTVAENDPKDILRILEGSGVSGEVVLTRRADEELLSILRCSRHGGH